MTLPQRPLSSTSGVDHISWPHLNFARSFSRCLIYDITVRCWLSFSLKFLSPYFIRWVIENTSHVQRIGICAGTSTNKIPNTETKKLWGLVSFFWKTTYIQRNLETFVIPAQSIKAATTANCRFPWMCQAFHPQWPMAKITVKHHQHHRTLEQEEDQPPQGQIIMPDGTQSNLSGFGVTRKLRCGWGRWARISDTGQRSYCFQKRWLPIDFHVGHWIGWLGVEPAKKIVALIRVLWCISEGHWTSQFRQWFVGDWVVSVIDSLVPV